MSMRSRTAYKPARLYYGRKLYGSEPRPWAPRSIAS